LHSAGFNRTGCYGVVGPDPSAVLDKFKGLLSSPLGKYREVNQNLQLDDVYHNVVHNASKILLKAMNKREFSNARTRLGKTQTQMAELLRISPKAIQSYEQGWRSIPAHAERQLLFLLSLKQSKAGQKDCWNVKKCSLEKRAHCPAWEFKAGTLCWFINGTLCEGKVQRDWRAKMKICRSCKVMSSLLASK
jgi:DNA-binding transcriptional regulator YiaG